MSLFPLCSPQIPPMIGRARIFKRMVDDLTKQTPQSLSLVGPRFFGKSVVVSALAKAPQIAEKYLCVVEWDLGHQIPQSDEEFIAAMRKKLSSALAGKNDLISEHLDSDAAGYGELLESFEMLEADNQRVLMIWDGVDPTIGSGKLTRNLWDNLLALGRKESLVLVTSSRRKLQELNRDPLSYTSEFWLLFDPVKLEAMNEEDIIVFSEKMADQTLQPGAGKEIINWTGGIPPLVVWLLNRIADVKAASISPGGVNEAAQNPDEKCSGLLERIWADNAAPLQDLYLDIVESGQKVYNELPKIGRAALIDAGFIVQHNGKASSACRLIQAHFGGTNPESGAIGRMFGSWENYTTNIRGILERRIAHLRRFDETLFHMVERAIEDVPLHIDTCLNGLTHIEERSLDIVWKRELEPDGCLPPAVISQWSQISLAFHESKRPRVLADMIRADEGGEKNAWKLPADRPSQLALLQLLTGSHQHYTDVVARCASKDTYVLLNAIHCFRNRSQHSGGQVIGLGAAVSALMLCIELLACLDRETP
jgi:hypothetical protein